MAIELLPLPRGVRVAPSDADPDGAYVDETNTDHIQVSVKGPMRGSPQDYADAVHEKIGRAQRVLLTHAVAGLIVITLEPADG